MPAESLHWTFDTAAELYEKYRACYVAEIFEDIFTYKPIGTADTLIEVGIGTGHATKPFLDTGASVTAVEYGAHLSALCRRKFAAYPNLRIVTQRFEAFECPPASVDLVYSASAFHWIPEEIGYTKVYDMLRPGGVFARFANHPYPDREKTAMSEEIQAIYRAYTPHRGGVYAPPIPYTEEKARDRANIAAAYGFTDIAYRLYHSTRTFTADGYIGLLGTYSDVIVMEEPVRSAFLEEIRQVILRHGDRITIYDTLDLQLARKA